MILKRRKPQEGGATISPEGRGIMLSLNLVKSLPISLLCLLGGRWGKTLIDTL